MTGLIVLIMGLGLAGQLAAPPPSGIYQLTVVDRQILRMDTRTGEIAQCVIDGAALRCEVQR